MPVIFFDVVRDEPVVGLIAEMSEVAPSAQENVTQKQFVLGTDRHQLFARRAIEPKRQLRAQGPKQENGRGDKERMRIQPDKYQSDQDRDGRHYTEIAIYRCQFVAGFGFGCGLPFQQAKPKPATN